MAKISKDMIIADLVKMDQNIIPILMREGMHCIGCPSAQGESLEEAALVHGMNPDVLVARLNNFLGEEYSVLKSKNTAESFPLRGSVSAVSVFWYVVSR